MRYDIAIVGSGPAGLSAAINAKIAGKNIIIYGDKDFSPKLIKAVSIKNYLGFPDITGTGLRDRFQENLDFLEIEITEKKVSAVYAMKNYFMLNVDNDMEEATAVIVAAGIEHKKTCKNEDDFFGNGLSNCATCDGNLYRGKTVYVMCESEEEENDIIYLSNLVNKVILSTSYEIKNPLPENVELTKAKPLSINGSDKVDGIMTTEGEIKADGYFILKSSVSPSQLVPHLMTDNGHITVNRKMETNLKGLYAAGDVTGRPYQYMKATGEGLIAAQEACVYINRLARLG